MVCIQFANDVIFMNPNFMRDLDGFYAWFGQFACWFATCLHQIDKISPETCQPTANFDQTMQTLCKVSANFHSLFRYSNFHSLFR